MKRARFSGNVPRNVTILALAVTIVLGIFRLIPLLILVWVVALTYIILYQYRASKASGSSFVCLECATMHSQNSCPKCGSKLKKLYSKTNSFGV
ncbi:MAG TPA: hypothetical protein VJ792_00855 [Candidatus Nitrosotalea sp.]|nr:hypothetical protein [Candidatus Nitrosotalea sp.]